VIPQTAHVFQGTVRFNLDPFEELPDRELWAVLEEVGLFDLVKEMDDGLNSQLSETGWTLDAAQVQLLCLARVILSKSQILCCDEATANLDPDMQAFVTKKIKEHFHKSTVLTIAHRLHTIIDSDRILMLDNGQVVDFGEPYTLIKNEGPFFNLIDHFGQSTKDDIILLAKDSFDRKHGLSVKRSSRPTLQSVQSVAMK
jgi:ATP-binding cassette subfamily C (CFTR/MRP) protein 4